MLLPLDGLLEFLEVVDLNLGLADLCDLSLIAVAALRLSADVLADVLVYDRLLFADRLREELPSRDRLLPPEWLLDRLLERLRDGERLTLTALPVGETDLSREAREDDLDALLLLLMEACVAPLRLDVAAGLLLVCALGLLEGDLDPDLECDLDSDLDPDRDRDLDGDFEAASLL